MVLLIFECVSYAVVFTKVPLLVEAYIPLRAPLDNAHYIAVRNQR